MRTSIKHVPIRSQSRVCVHYEDVYNICPHNVCHVCVYYEYVYNGCPHNVSVKCVCVL